MAYQPKSYRKFLATGVATAMVATAVAPTVSADTHTNFSDVEAGVWYEDDLAFAVENGLIEGFPDGTFRPAEGVTRAQAAALIVRASDDLEESDSADLPFNDTQDDVWYSGAVQAAVDAGIFQGYPDGSFQPNGVLTRAEFAQVVVETFGLELDERYAVDFDDVDDEWYAENVNILASLGIVQGESDGIYNPSGEVNRAQATTFFHRTLNPDVRLTPDAVLELEVNAITPNSTTDFTVGLSSAIDEEFDLEDVAAALDVSVVLEDGTTVVPEATDLSLNEDRTAINVEHENDDLDGLAGTLIVNGFELDFDYTALVVNEVTADNLKEVWVNYSQDVSNVDGITDEDNYELEEEDGSDIDIDDIVVDGANVRIILEDAAEQQSTATLTIGDQVLEAEEEFEVNFFDTTIPTAESAEVIGSRTAKVVFSEPIKAENLTDGFELENENGTSFAVGDVTLYNGNREARVEFLSDFEEETYTLTVTNALEDFAGYNVTARQFTLDVDPDEDAPNLVGARSTNQLQATLEFDEDVTFTDRDEDVIYATTPAGGLEDGEAVDADFVQNFYHTNSSNTASKVELDGSEVKVTFSRSNSLPDGTANLYVAGETMEDLWGNVQESQQRVSIGIDVDETAPSVLSVQQNREEGPNTFDIEFNENVDLESAEDDDNYTVVDSDGDEVNVDTITLVEDDTVRVVLDSGEELTGDFAVTVDGVEDLVGNEMSEETVGFSLVSVNAPSFSDFGGNFVEGDDETQVIVEFDKEMAVSGQFSVEDLDKYEIDGTVLSDVDGATINAIDDNTAVQIQFDNDDFEDANDNDRTLEDIASSTGDTLLVTMTRVADSAGNRTELTGNFPITNVEGASVGISEAVAVDNDTVVVEFDENLTSFSRNDFKFVEDGDDFSDEAATRISSVTRLSASEYEFNLADDLDSDATINGTEVDLVTRTDSTSTNRFGNNVDTANEDVEDEIAPELDTDADVNSDYYDSDNVHEFELPFTENVGTRGSNQDFAKANFSVTDSDGNEYTVTDTTYDNLDEEEFSVELSTVPSSSNTVTVYVYGTDEDETFTVDFARNAFFVDNSENRVESFSVDVEQDDN